MLDLESINRDADEKTEIPAGQGTVFVETVTDEAGFGRLQADWNRVLESSTSPNIFLTWEWISTWWKHFGTSNELHVLVAREPSRGTIVGLLPLMRKRQPFAAGPIRELSFLTSPLTAPDHLDLIANRDYEKLVVETVVETLRAQQTSWDVLSLNGISADSALLKALQADLPECNTFQWERVCPYVSLPATWEEYLNSLPKKYRHNIRNRERKFQRDVTESVRFNCVSREGERELNQALSDLFSMHEEIRKIQGEAGAFDQRAMREFHREIAKQFLYNDWLRLYQLQVDNRTVATAYCFRYGETVSYYQTGYDNAWSGYGPGVALLIHVLRSSINEGMSTFDFLRGDHAYKYRWTNQSRRDFKFGLASSFKGKAVVSVYSALRKARECWKSLRRGKCE